VYRKRWCLHIDKLTHEKGSGQQVQIPIHPSNCTITTLKMDKDRKRLLERKKVLEKGKGKYKAGQTDMDLD
jgi:large subunit ribosomal protein L26e